MTDLPRLASVVYREAYEITVEWVAGSTAAVDLAPLVLTHKFYKPLRTVLNKSGLL